MDKNFLETLKVTISDFQYLNAFYDDQTFTVEIVSSETEKHIFTEPISSLHEVYSKTKEYSFTQNLELCSANSYEVMVKDQGDMRRDINEGPIEDVVNGVSYSLSKPSKEFWLNYFLRGEVKLRVGPLTRYKVERILALKSNPNFSIFNILGELFTFEKTILIKTNQHLNPSVLRKLLNAYVFHIGFNFSSPYLPKSFDLKVDEKFANLRRRLRLDDPIDAPKIIPKEELVFYYLSALSSTNPFNQFISYYHIIEHFFESVVEEESIRKIRYEMTKPNFSVANDRSLKELVKTIKNTYKIKSDGASLVDERKALQLTLRKFCDLEVMKQEYPNMEEYFSVTAVPFSKGPQFEFLNDDSSFSKLSNRIYSTRNSLIHSKDTDKTNYKPFIDSSSLVKEIPLLRAIAEQILNRSAELINFTNT